VTIRDGKVDIALPEVNGRQLGKLGQPVLALINVEC
jgi:hypothetical protein